MLLVALPGLAAPAALAGQEIAGHAVDEAGAPLPEVPVALHRVGGGSGATVDATTTDEDGRFRFVIQQQDSALYFVAMRHDDRLYIGPPARGGAEIVSDYQLRADPANEAGAVASALSRGPESAPGGGPAGMAGGAGRATGSAAAWFVALLALVVAGVFIATAPGYRRRRQREALMELAAIEDRLDAAGSDSAEREGERDRRRRAALRQRLAPHG